MLLVYCDACGEEINIQGGLLYGPPKEDRHSLKYHLCLNCYERVKTGIETYKLVTCVTNMATAKKEDNEKK